MRLVFAAALLAVALPVTAQIYQYTDDKGNRVYTDQPPLGVDATSIELRAVNSLPAPASTQPVAPSTLDPTELTAPYSVLLLSGLPDDEALRANNGTFSVEVEITPKLASQHRLQLIIDGQAHGPASTTTTLHVVNLDRGEHRLAVQVLADEQVVQSSAEHTLTVQRVHTSSPAFRSNPAPSPTP
ncbi:DUF4124 domain-containing protein [Pseudomonas sp. C27(2019)]|uniref:DUF4124 domain-containing protein n=1 Tax=Pseudomonas sp. C27(2019) TaxID=2604941 RepID=UPI001244235D|nr:DUF4124 domain-containing protein [Pseudomonas sp. C27(2019)]QEY59701.1 DUF4124 domain-containing protein [Pseudomonas sp. C27(2019)]